MIWRALRRRCPRCGAKPFESYFRIKTHCDRCGLRFEREDGYWAGALIINTTVTFGAFLVIFVGAMVVFWPDVPWGAVLGVTIAANLAIPVVFYPVSKTLWLALELSWHPLEPHEMEEAGRWASQPEFQSPL